MNRNVLAVAIAGAAALVIAGVGIAIGVMASSPAIPNVAQLSAAPVVAKDVTGPTTYEDLVVQAGEINPAFGATMNADMVHAVCANDRAYGDDVTLSTAVASFQRGAQYAFPNEQVSALFTAVIQFCHNEQ